MIREIFPDNARILYDFFIANNTSTPYYFPVSYENWHSSMFNDCDYDGSPLFSEIKTFALYKNETIEGYIQFGTTSFAFDKKGARNFDKGYGIIRSLYYLPKAENADMLLEKAMEYFHAHKVKKKMRFAFFHYFGMSCYARQGKLHESAFFVEELLARYSFEKQHENVYFSKELRQGFPARPLGIDFSYSDNRQSIKFMKDGTEIGGCELYFVPGAQVCFIKWIYIHKQFSHKGLGTQSMYQLFHEMRKRGFARVDTDAIDSNINAQRYYEKTGFANRGIMRDYAIDFRT